MDNCNDGRWNGWNGGECPVHPQSTVEVVVKTPWGLSDGKGEIKAEGYEWDHENGSPIIAFRVVKPYRGPREYWMTTCNGYTYAHRSMEAAQTYCRCTPAARMFQVREVMEDQP